MSGLDVKMVLSLVDKASGPAQRILAGIGGRDGVGGVGMQAAAANGALMALSRTAAGLGAGVLGALGFQTAVGGAMEFEAAMADVEKKVPVTAGELDSLRESILAIARDSPLAKTEVASLIAQAGQFGIANRDLTRFAQLGAKAAVAFEMTAEESANSLSQVKNALKLNIEELEVYADAINMVADSTGSSERQLVDFALRTGPGALAAGLDPKDLLAFGASLNEIGIGSERASTAVNSMLAKMTILSTKKTTTKLLDQIGGKGFSAQTQKKFFERPRDAMIDLLKVTREMTRSDRANVFIDLFGLETQDEAMAFASQVDKVEEVIRRLGDSSQYVGGVNKTFEIFANTTEQQLKQFRQNISDTADAFGAQLLPSINGSLVYLNRFFSTSENRIDVFERMTLAANGFFNGLGFKGGSKEALADAASGLSAIRDLIFGVEGDGRFGEGQGEIFKRWQDFGNQLAGNPIVTTLDTIAKADVSQLGISLTAGAAGLGLLGIAARVALSPLKLIFGVMSSIAGVAYTLSGLSTVKWLLDLARVPAGGNTPGGGAPGGGRLGLLSGLLGPKALAALGMALATQKVISDLSEDYANQLKLPPARDYSPGYTAEENAQRQAKLRSGLNYDGERHRSGEAPINLAPSEVQAQPFSWGSVWQNMMRPIGSAGDQSVSINGPVTTAPSGVQDVRMTNPTPASNINVNVYATTNASAAEIRQQAGAQVGAAFRAAISDGGN